MFRTTVALLLLVAIVACGQNESGQAGTDQQQPSVGSGPAISGTSTAGKTYPMYCVIVSRDPARNTVNIDNEDVPGVMAPMKMSYEVRGAEVGSLPPDGTRVAVTLHEQQGTYWVTDVKPTQ